MRIIEIISVAVVSVALLGPAYAQEEVRPESDKQSAAGREERAEMQKEVEEAAAAIRAYSAARRDEAETRAKSALDDMDRRIQQLEAGWQANAERRTAALRDRRDRAMAALRKQRAELAAQYRSMEASSTETWLNTRDAFIDDYRDLAESLSQAMDRQAPQTDAGAGEPEEPGSTADDEETPPGRQEP